MRYTTRPTIPEWPGYSCGKSLEQWEAPYRGHQGVFDCRLRKARLKAHAQLQAAIQAGDEVKVEIIMAALQTIREGKLAERPKRMRTLGSGAPLVKPAGKTTAMTMANRQPNESWTN